jgi:hypothetical protein
MVGQWKMLSQETAAPSARGASKEKGGDRREVRR